MSLAQVIVIKNSFPANRKQFNESIKLMNLLDMKGCDYILVDVNTDASKFTSDAELLNTLKDGNFLYMSVEDPTRILVPQVLFDGISVGDHTDLQELEDDDILDGIMDGNTCPACKFERGGGEVCQQSSCGYAFTKLVSPEELAAGRFLVLRSRFRVNEEYAQMLVTQDAQNA